MATFPQSSTLRAIFGFKPLKIENVARPLSESGKSQSKDLWGKMRFQPDPCEFQVTRSDKEAIRQFCEANRTGSFYFYNYDTEDVTAQQNIGTGDGSTKIFTVPAREIYNATVYDNGSVVSSANYSVTVGTGPNLEDQISFVTAPVSGHAITIIYSGRLRYLAEQYKPHEITPVNPNLWSVRIYIREYF